MEEPFIHQVRELPEITIEGTAFIVDVAFAELRQKDNPENTISFHDLNVEGDKYAFHCDAQTAIPTWEETEGSVKVSIDQMVKLDPEGVAKKYGLAKENLPVMDAELQCDPALLKRRLQDGQLPIIGIMGQNYFVDLRLNELRSTDEHWKRIDLTEVDVTPADKFAFFYDYTKKEVVDIPHTITCEPKNVVVVELPHELWLDPIESARKYVDNELDFIDLYPLQHELQARIRPLSGTYVPELIRQNNQKKLKETKVIAENVSENKRRKGKRL